LREKGIAPFYKELQIYFDMLCSISEYAQDVLNQLKELPTPIYEHIVLVHNALPNVLEKNTLYLLVAPVGNESCITFHSTEEQFQALDSANQQKLLKKLDDYKQTLPLVDKKPVKISASTNQTSQQCIQSMVAFYRGIQFDKIVESAQGMPAFLMGLHPRVGAGKPRDLPTRPTVSTKSTECNSSHLEESKELFEEKGRTQTENKPSEPSSLQVLLNQDLMGGHVTAKNVLPIINFFYRGGKKPACMNEPSETLKDNKLAVKSLNPQDPTPQISAFSVDKGPVIL
jgi:hypothetical protein